jgi:hypothetical protein
MDEEKKMVRVGSVFVAGLLIVFSGAAHAQATVGEVLDGGGQQVAREELLAVLGGTTLSGPTSTGNETQADLKIDGAITGSIRSPAGHTGSYFGKWLVDDQGRFCRDIKINFRNSTSTDSSCVFYFRMAERYFIADSAERTATVLPRTIVRK